MDIPRRTFVVCDFSCFYAVNTRMSGLIYVPSTDIDDGGKTRIGGHFFRKEFLPDVSLNSLGKWMYHFWHATHFKRSRQSFFEHHSFFID